MLKHRGYKGRGAPFFDNVPTAFYRGGWGVMMAKHGRRSGRIDEDEGLDSPVSRGIKQCWRMYIGQIDEDEGLDSPVSRGIKQCWRMYIGQMPISVIDMCMQCSYRLGRVGGDKRWAILFIGNGRRRRV